MNSPAQRQTHCDRCACPIMVFTADPSVRVVCVPCQRERRAFALVPLLLLLGGAAIYCFFFLS